VYEGKKRRKRREKSGRREKRKKSVNGYTVRAPEGFRHEHECVHCMTESTCAWTTWPVQYPHNIATCCLHKLPGQPPIRVRYHGQPIVNNINKPIMKYIQTNYTLNYTDQNGSKMTH
jgi:hypothetical protein